MSSASLINQYKDKGDFEKVNKHVQRIKSSVSHLTTILNDFLSLGKLEEGKIDVVFETINVEEFLTEVHDEMKASLKANQEIVVTASGHTQTIDTDTRIMRNILFNLVSNASKYSDEGKHIYLQATQQEQQIVFSVRDEGIGIPESEFKHMFERFFRASNAINIQGTGLGLNIVKRYVDLLSGTILFESDYGKGSTFTVIIPQHAPVKRSGLNT